MAHLTQDFIDFVATFKNDPEINRLPLPDSVRKATGIYHNLSYVNPAEACTRAIFAPNNWDTMEEIKNDPSVPFPDLAKLAEEYRKEYAVEDKKEEEKQEEEQK
jgi:hypothetical protein